MLSSTVIVSFRRYIPHSRNDIRVVYAQFMNPVGNFDKESYDGNNLHNLFQIMVF
jgi:hypothetical protein